jgi:ArsR family transcriptional regulator
MVSDPVLEQMESLFMAFADKTRLRLLNLMRDGEVCVCFFVEVLGESQPKISRHLAYLRNAGLVEARRDGKWAHYKIVEPDDPGATRVLNDVLAWLGEQQDMKLDIERYANVCCSPELLVQIARTPIDFVLPSGANGEVDVRDDDEDEEEFQTTPYEPEPQPVYQREQEDTLEDFLL